MSTGEVDAVSASAYVRAILRGWWLIWARTCCCSDHAELREERTPGGSRLECLCGKPLVRRRL
jgi:hypothetical protein